MGISIVSNTVIARVQLCQTQQLDMDLINFVGLVASTDAGLVGAGQGHKLRKRSSFSLLSTKKSVTFAFTKFL